MAESGDRLPAGGHFSAIPTQTKLVLPELVGSAGPNGSPGSCFTTGTEAGEVEAELTPLLLLLASLRARALSCWA